MPKRKRPRVPPRSHHPSQSSIDVPAALKTQVKAMHKNKCWLCDQKAHKRDRPLQICHIYPQAISKRHKFVKHHMTSRTQLNNIHSVENLIPLCSICHLAFDQEEWTFLPKDMEAWVQALKTNPERNSVSEYNSRRDVEFRRWRLQNDPSSEASQDEHYVSAFTDRPIQTWRGEAGVVIIRNISILDTPLDPDTDIELQKALAIYDELRAIWFCTNEPCLNDQCRICRHEEQDGGDEGEDEGDERDEEEDKWEDEEGGGRDREDQMDREDKEGEGSEEDQPSSKIRKTAYWDRMNSIGPTTRSRSYTTYQNWTNSTGPITRSRGRTTHQNWMNSTGPTTRSRGCTTNQNWTNRTRPIIRTRRGTTRNVIQKKSKPKPRKSALYDKSVPYSHREGYTFARCTSNDMMAMWQTYHGINELD